MAVIVVSSVIFTVHLPVPVQFPPLQPRKVEFASGVTLRVTFRLVLKVLFAVVQSVEQFMPEGALLMLPFPIPSLLMVRTGSAACVPAAVKNTNRAAIIISCIIFALCFMTKSSPKF